MSISVEERRISVEELLSTVEGLQGLPELEESLHHGEVEASCTVTCSGERSCGASCQTD
jgi:hypothetical protein